jgi:hypothetical protein
MDARPHARLPRALDRSPAARVAPGIFRDLGAPAWPCIGRRAPRTSQGRIHGRKGARMSFKLFSDCAGRHQVREQRGRQGGSE